MFAPAKVNLMLHVTGRREDGYHLLQSLVMFADVGDKVSEADIPGLEITGPFAAPLDGSDNLVTKAARALGMHDAGLRLDKQLPIGAGLGGGSADAAATLRLLGIDTAINQLQHIAATLGSDVPACFLSAPLWMEGVGEKITRVRMLFDVPAILVNSGAFVSSKEVYERLAPPYETPIDLPKNFDSHTDLLSFLHTTRNMLEMPARLVEPSIRQTLDAISLLPQCLLARMSGSGATCFGLFSSSAASKAAAELIKAAHPDWWVAATTLKGNHG